MTKITLEIKQCSECPYIKTETVYEEDSFSRDEDWFCTKTKRKKNKIAGMVHWTEQPSIPEWCPILLKKDK